MKKGLVFLLLLVTSPVFAGYTYRNGYWYDGEQAYTQNRFYQPGYNGCCGYYYFTYTPYYPPAVAAEAPYKAEGWRDTLLKGVLNERKNAQEQTYYMDAITAFGIKGVNITSPVPSQTTYGQAFFAPQASTVYGYTYHDLTKVYGDTDINQLYQAAARQAENSQRYAAEGNNNFAALVDQAAKDKAKFAEILARSNEIVAKGQAFALAMKSLEERKIVIENKGSVSLPPIVPAEAPRMSEGLLKLSALFGQDCSGCHNAVKKNGGIDLADWRNFDSGTKLKVFNAVSNPDSGKRMPRVEGGGAGRQWTNEEAKLLLTN